MKNIATTVKDLARALPLLGTIAIASIDSYEFVAVADIIRCEGWEKYTKVHLVDGRTIVSSYNIGVYKQKLAAFRFFHSHKSHLVNEKHLSKYLKEGILIMSDGAQVPVSRRKKEEISSVLYVRRGTNQLLNS